MRRASFSSIGFSFLPLAGLFLLFIADTADHGSSPGPSLLFFSSLVFPHPLYVQWDHPNNGMLYSFLHELFVSLRILLINQAEGAFKLPSSSFPC